MKYIDPNDVKGKLDFPLFYKESFLLFAVLVAGKNSTMIMHKTNQLIKDIINEENPTSLFQYIIDNHSDNGFKSLDELLRKNKTGKYSLIINFFKDIKKSNIDLLSCKIEELESLRGVGKKSSRFFMVYNRSDQQDCAILDTHLLKFLNKNGYPAPEQTPSGKKYDELEAAFISLAKTVRPKQSIADIDFEIWYQAKENGLTPFIDVNGTLTFENNNKKN